MRKRNLIFPLVVSSLFMPSIEALERTTDLNSLESENNIYEAVDILIAEGGGGGGGGGGGQKVSDKKANDLKKAIKGYNFFVDKREEAIRKRESTSEIDRINYKIKKFEKKIIELDPDYFPPIMEIMGGGPNSRPKEPETQDANGELDIPIGEGGSDARTNREDNKRTREYKEAIEYNKTDNKLGSAVPLRELRKKVLNLKKKINKIQYKEGDFFEFIDTQYASLYKLDLIESHIILLMSELKKFDDVATRKIPFDKYSPNIKEVEKQQKVLEGLDIQSHKYLSSLNLDFIGLRSFYSRSTLEKMKMLKGTNNQSDDSGFAEAWRSFMERENER